MKKYFRLLGSLILMISLTGMLFAGGEGEKEAGSSAAKGQTLTIWSTLTQESRATELENIARMYEQANPGVKVEITVMPWSGAFDKMIAAIMAGNPPDIATVGQGWPQSLAGSGGIVTVEDVVAKVGGPDAFLGTSLSVLGSLEGENYALPLYVTPHVIMYRKSWLKEVGMEAPKTWDDLLAACKAVTDPAKNRYGFALPFTDIHGGKPIWGFLLSNNVTIFKKDAKGEWQLDIDRKAAVETYEYLYDLLKNAAPSGVVSYDTKEIRELLAKGVVMSRLDTPEVYPVVRDMDESLVDDFAYVPLPPKKRLGSSQGWVGLVAFEKGKVSLAKDFMEFMFSGDKLVDFYLSYPYAMFPSLEALYSNPAYANGVPDELKPLVPMAPDILANSAGIAMWNGDNPWAGEIENKSILSNALSDMLVKGISAEEAVDQITSEIKNLMGR